MNSIERNKLVAKALQANLSGNHRLAQLVAHQIACLSDEEIPPNTKEVLIKLGASLI